MKIMKNAANTHNLGLRDIAASIITSINGGLPVRTHFDT
jgi:hypothetical protein